LVLGGALEDGRGWDPAKTRTDFHWNERHQVLINVVRSLELDEHGVPIYQRDDETMQYSPKLLETPQLDKLITSPQQAVQHYLEFGETDRFDFDPDPDAKPRDLWGRYHDHEDLEKGIVTDVKRMAERPYEIKQEVRHDQDTVNVEVEAEARSVITLLSTAAYKTFHWAFTPLRKRAKQDQVVTIWGPTHSAVDLVGELTAEGLVMIGKYQRHKKLRSKRLREYLLGEISIRDALQDVARWYGTHVPAMAENVVYDAELFFEWVEWLSRFSNHRKGAIGSFLRAKVTHDRLREIVEDSPAPTNYRALCNQMRYYKFDPEQCLWGFDHTGKPRLPMDLLKRLAQDPSKRGLNMATHDGRRVLTLYRRRIGTRKIREFWGLQPEDISDILDLGREQAREKLNIWTMGYALFHPTEEPDKNKSGLLGELYNNQPAGPTVEWIEGLIRWLKRTNELHIRKHIDRALEGVHIGPELQRYVERWYEDSDERVWNFVYFFDAAGSSLDNVSGAEAFKPEMAMRLNDEAFGLGYGTLAAQQERQERLFEVGLKAKYYTTMKGLLEWACVRHSAVKLAPEFGDNGLEPNRTWVDINELKLKVAHALESRALIYPLARDVLWPKLKRRNIIGEEEDFPFKDVPASEIEWGFVKEELDLLCGNDLVSSVKSAAADPAKEKELVRIAANNHRRLVKIQRGEFFEINQE
jgi:hypothetical protein